MFDVPVFSCHLVRSGGAGGSLNPTGCRPFPAKAGTRSFASTVRLSRGLEQDLEARRKLRPATVRVNRLFSSIRCKIEKVFGWWKRSAGYRRVRYVGHEPNRLELEFKCICWNLKRLTNLSAA